MGLVAKPNQDVERTNNAPAVSTDANVIALFDVPDSDTLVANKKVHPMPEEDQKYISKCMEKHADDYGKIFRDIKVNNMQYSEAQLRKMAARFLLLDTAQRKVELPDKVKGFALESS
jgi:hypothetical protein